MNESSFIDDTEQECRKKTRNTHIGAFILLVGIVGIFTVTLTGGIGIITAIAGNMMINHGHGYTALWSSIKRHYWVALASFPAAISLAFGIGAMIKLISPLLPSIG